MRRPDLKPYLRQCTVLPNAVWQGQRTRQLVLNTDCGMLRWIMWVMEWGNHEHRIAIVTLHHADKSAADIYSLL